MSSLIELRNVTKRFVSDGKNVTALDRVDLTVDRGEIFAIIGNSGAGKSTLVRLMNGLERVDGGSITIDGTDITRLPERHVRTVRQKTGMVFQQFNLFSSRTVAGNVAFPLRVARWPQEKRDARVAELLDFVGLLARAHSYPDQLSGGQKQRVGIARALAASPTLLLADEATSALDPATTEEVLELLSRINRELGVTVVVITHEMDVVRRVADRVAVLENGQVIETNTVFDLFNTPQSSTAQSFVRKSLRDRPDSAAEWAHLRQRHPGRIVIAQVHDDARIGSVLSRAAEHGVTFDLLHGGIRSLQNKSFGSLTIELIGASTAVEAIVAELRAITTVEEAPQ